ncbi:MAG: hypothetical protein ACJ8DZ_13825 [Allosphingosinicella sp.]
MADDAPTAPAAAETETIVVHPGDVIQVIDQKHATAGCLLIVEGCYGWGVGGTMHWIADGRAWESYHRLKVGQFAVVGAASIVKPEILAARRDSIGTAELVRMEGP